jgi:hypothetical protein
MVSILQASFIYWMNCPEEAETPKNDEELFGNILRALENAGMQPPMRYFENNRACPIAREWEEE